MSSEPIGRKINWYRSPIEREALNALNQHSDWKGLVQTLGHLGLLVLTGATAWHAVGRMSWPVVLLILFPAWHILRLSAERLPRIVPQYGLQEAKP